MNPRRSQALFLRHIESRCTTLNSTTTHQDGMPSLRTWLVLGMAGFLAFFFLPLIPFAKTLHFSCVFSCPPSPPGGSFSGYDSIGYLLTGWGASYSAWLGGYLPPAISLSSSQGPITLTAFGALVAVVLPIAVVSVGVLAPQIVRRSNAARVAFVTVSACISFFSLAELLFSRGALIPLVESEALALVLLGGVMATYGLGRWIFHPGQTA